MDVQAHELTETDAKLFENLVDCDEAMINHVVIAAGDGFDAHPTDAHVFILVRRGELTLTFANGTTERFGTDLLVEIPYQTLIKIDNCGTGPLELIVTKAPNPKTLNARG